MKGSARIHTLLSPNAAFQSRQQTSFARKQITLIIHHVSALPPLYVVIITLRIVPTLLHKWQTTRHTPKPLPAAPLGAMKRISLSSICLMISQTHHENGIVYENMPHCANDSCTSPTPFHNLFIWPSKSEGAQTPVDLQLIWLPILSVYMSTRKRMWDT